MTISQTKKSVSVWQRLYSIKHDDIRLTAETWAEVQPCKTFNFFGKEVMITQPSSTFWVYLLGILTTLLGVFFCVADDNQVSRMLWGISLILWGVGALLAGTSYQAFGYQLKCAGRPEVVWTSWWEVIYLIFQQVSVSVMLVAVAFSSLPELGRIVSVYVAVLVSVIYIFIVFWGAFKPKKSFITFELMVKFCSPFIFFCIGLNGVRYFQSGSELELALLGTWLGLLVTMWLFYDYSRLEWTEKLWEKGSWFSENDVLHVALVIWVFYIAFVLEPLVNDFSL